jgi:hypothetical protein
MERAPFDDTHWIIECSPTEHTAAAIEKFRGDCGTSRLAAHNHRSTLQEF